LLNICIKNKFAATLNNKHKLQVNQTPATNTSTRCVKNRPLHFYHNYMKYWPLSNFWYQQ